MLWGVQFVGEGCFFYFFQVVGLGFVVVFCYCFGKVGEQYGKLQLDIDGGGKGGVIGQGVVSYGDCQQGG